MIVMKQKLFWMILTRCSLFVCSLLSYTLKNSVFYLKTLHGSVEDSKTLYITNRKMILLFMNLYNFKRAGLKAYIIIISRF